MKKLMKKIVLLVIFAIWGTVCSYAQYERPRMPIFNLDDYEVLDFAYLKVTYRLLSVKDPAKPKETVEDIQVLQIGTTVSKFYSQYLLQYSETIAEELRKKPNTQAIANNPYSGSYGYEVFRNYPIGKVTVTDQAMSLNNDSSTYLYEETLLPIPWTLSSETKTILSYTCRKATATFRGRSYTAWFTTDIPISSGPWKFGGLPGLILQIEDTQKHYVWECIGLEQLQPRKEAIKLYNNSYDPISREELDKIYRRYHKDRVAFRVALGIMVLTNSPDGTPVEIKTGPEIPYNPIELE
ncbi:MAG: GLPGLI family protein [Rikenellaceae bacterium]|jgi:GLPGLI family protein|nr:GLPGLI family protein [Rikenellaceae bacterium]